MSSQINKEEFMSTTIQELKEKQMGLITQAQAIAIADEKSLMEASDALTSIKALLKEIDAFFDGNINRLHKAHREALAQKKAFTTAPLEAERGLKLRIREYLDEQERIRREAEEKAQQEEQARIEAAKRAEEERLVAALKAEEAGDSAKAEEILNEAPPEFKPLPPAPVGPVMPKISGMSTSTIWKFDIVDPAKIPSEFMVPNFTKIGQVIRATKGTLQIPGIRIYSERSVSVGKGIGGHSHVQPN